MHAVGEIHIGGSGWPIEGLGAGGAAVAVRVTRRILGTDVGLHLDDPAGGLPAPAADITHEDLAQ